MFHPLKVKIFEARLRAKMMEPLSDGIRTLVCHLGGKTEQFVCPVIKQLKAEYTNLSGEVETLAPPFGELTSKKKLLSFTFC
jgi:hypothetical protein